MQGYLRRGQGQDVWFITGRHEIRGKEVLDGFASLPAAFDVTLHRPATEAREVRAVCKRGTGNDRVAVKLEGVTGVGAVKFGQAVEGGAVSAHYYHEASREWKLVVGVVRAVRGDIIAYELSTMPGTCRMAVFDGRGQIVAGHYYPYVPVGQQLLPAGEPENGGIPSGWVESYSPPPVYFDTLPHGRDAGATSEEVSRLVPYLRTEDFKVYGLRRDARMEFFKPEYHIAKPSTAMLFSEVEKFFEPLAVAFDKDVLKEAVFATAILDYDGRSFALVPTAVDFENTLRLMDNERTNAGSDLFGGNHHEYILERGGGDVEKGITVIAADALRLYGVICGDVAATEEDELALLKLRMWCIQGKRDGYKDKKLYVGRSIQAPSLMMKLLHRTVFGQADTDWLSRQFMFRAGYDMDQAVPDRLSQLYGRTVASLGLDESAFDRRMPREFMQAYFQFLLPFMCQGAPREFCEFMGSCAIDSLLVFTTGDVREKRRGNPSGYPNTLRLNCVVQLLSWCYAALIRSKELGLDWGHRDVVDLFERDVFLEICGDDSRANVLTPLGLEFLDGKNDFAAWLAVWRKHLPWDVKIEGSVLFEHKFTDEGVRFNQPFEWRAARFPPLVARNLFVVEDRLYSPLHNPARCVRGLMSRGSEQGYGALGRSQEDEEELRFSAFVTLKLHLWWHLQNHIFCPVVQMLLDNDWLTVEVRNQVRAHYAAIYAEARTRVAASTWDQC